MKFEFSLESVLKVREHKEKVQKQKLAEKISKKQNLDERKQQLQTKLQRLLDRAERREFENIHDFRRNREYIENMREKVRKLNKSLRSVEQALEKQREKLAEVHKDHNIMEKLKEEEREEFMEKLSRQKRKIMDEVATQTHSD